MQDPRQALTPPEVAKLWVAIQADSTQIKLEFLPPDARPPGASRLTAACIWTAPAVLVDAGLRPSELASLQWADVQGLDGKQAWLNIAAVNSKSHRARQIACTSRLTARLAVHRELQRRAAGPAPSTVLHAYPAQAAAISTRTLQRWINWVSQSAIARIVRPYDLRHTYATLLLRVADIETVRQALGHRHISTTQHYLHTQSESHRSAAGEFETATTGD